MIQKPLEAKATLYRENARWVLAVELPGWLSLDLIKELEGHALVDINEGVDLSEDNLVTFVQMPLGEREFTCDNCGKRVALPAIDEPAPSFYARLKSYFRR